MNSERLERYVILDRDGVINQDSDAYIKSAEEWVPIPGSINAIAQLSAAGLDIFIATNQSGLARGLFDLETLDAMHQKMLALVEEAGGRIHSIVFCPHGPDEGCDCRKPQPGLVHQIEKIASRSAQLAWFVGDTSKDILAARATGASPILVKTGKGQRTLDKGEHLDGVRIADDLAEAANLILAELA